MWQFESFALIKVFKYMCVFIYMCVCIYTDILMQCFGLFQMTWTTIFYVSCLSPMRQLIKTLHPTAAARLFCSYSKHIVAHLSKSSFHFWSRRAVLSALGHAQWRHQPLQWDRLKVLWHKRTNKWLAWIIDDATLCHGDWGGKRDRNEGALRRRIRRVALVWFTDHFYFGVFTNKHMQ